MIPMVVNMLLEKAQPTVYPLPYQKRDHTPPARGHLDPTTITPRRMHPITLVDLGLNNRRGVEVNYRQRPVGSVRIIAT
jgi:hypothetical protein